MPRLRPPMHPESLKLDRAFYERPAVKVARDLLGCTIVHADPDTGIVRKARIVETEAYAGEHDLAAHSSKGRTARTEVMFGPPGHAYLYLIYGMHWCFNVVVERDGKAAAVLIRAAVPVENCDGPASGPGVLCRSLHLDRRRYGTDLCGDELYLFAREGKRPRVVTGPRINVDYAGQWALKPWRFAVDQEPAVSRPRPFLLTNRKVPTRR